MASEVLRTEYEFTLPRGYVDEHGDLYRDGTMRLALAVDEIEPLVDPRVQANEAYLGILVLSRVVTRLGGISHIRPIHIERLFAADFAYLQELYISLNQFEANVVDTECPACQTRFSLDLNAG